MIALIWAFASKAVSQYRVSIIRQLDIDIWPDYDQPSVLVLLTGRLPDKTKLPATVTLPLPESARLNAVARIDSKDDLMKDDIISSNDPPGMITFTTPDLRFRVEFYFPYIVNDNRHVFDYTWLAPVGINVFRLRVQQPSAAQSFKTDPDTANILKGNDGLSYHTFASQVVEAWQPVSIRVNYQMTGAKLSKDNLARAKPAAQNMKPQPQEPNKLPVNQVLVVMGMGGLFVFGVLLWRLFLRNSRESDQPSDHRSDRKGSASDKCARCGNSIAENDSFCSRCGKKL